MCLVILLGNCTHGVFQNAISGNAQANDEQLYVGDELEMPECKEVPDV